MVSDERLAELIELTIGRDTKARLLELKDRRATEQMLIEDCDICV